MNNNNTRNNIKRKLHSTCGSANPSPTKKSMLRRDRELVMHTNKNGDSVLHSACQSYSPSLKEISYLIYIGGRDLVMRKKKNGDTALHCACGKDNPSLEIIAMLLDIGGRDLVMQTNRNGDSVLHSACHAYIPSREVVSMLIKIGGRDLVMQTNGFGNSVLYSACHSFNPSLEIISMLLDIGGRELLIQTDRNGGSLLHYACITDNPSLEIISRLLDIGGRELLIQTDRNIEKSLLHNICRSSQLRDICRSSQLHDICRSGNPSFELISMLLNIGGGDLLMVNTGNSTMVNVHNTESIPLLVDSPHHISISSMKMLISEGIKHNIGGEFGIGGLFNSCTDMHGNTNHDHLQQKRIFHEWESLIVPALDKETQLLLNNQPILHAAIISKAPSNIIFDIIQRFPNCILFQDSYGRYPIDVGVKEGLRWDEGLMNILNETVATQQGQKTINVAALHGLKWDNGMKDVVEDNTTDIEHIDETTGFYPFILAATGGLGQSSDLNSIFNLMKKEPSLVRSHSNAPSVLVNY